MRIRSRIAVVGGVPVMVAAVIAVAGGLLLARSERVYESAVLAGSVYRDVLAATAARSSASPKPLLNCGAVG